MIIVKPIHIIIFLLPLLPTCTAFKKNIDKPVIVAMPDTLFMPALNPKCTFIKYLNHDSYEQYASAFIKGFKSEAVITKNITLTFDASNADFILKVRSLTFTESSRMDTVHDAKSTYNGQLIELNSVECAAVLEITDVKKNKTLNTCTNTKSRAEQFTNNRNLDDLINGRNKDKNNYKTKLLDDNICLSLSQDVGRRIWVPVTRRIAGDIK